jgi:predicted DCC family thiol-disulfide oxidoreductase YuxK
MSTGQQMQVWYDGNCEVCRRSRVWCEERDSQGRLRFIDFRAASDDELPVPRHELESSMWVRARDGALSSGFDGWRQIVSSLPRWRWLARLTGLPPFCWLGPPAYRLAARLRSHLPAQGSRSPKGPST